jgi:hypothetical protein
LVRKRAALAALIEAVRGLVLLGPGGIMCLRVSPRVMSATMPWLLAPTPTRSGRLLQLMLADGHTPSPALVQWMTLVARHTRSSLGAKQPVPAQSKVRTTEDCRSDRGLSRPTRGIADNADCLARSSTGCAGSLTGREQW